MRAVESLRVGFQVETGKMMGKHQLITGGLKAEYLLWFERLAAGIDVRLQKVLIHHQSSRSNTHTAIAITPPDRRSSFASSSSIFATASSTLDKVRFIDNIRARTKCRYTNEPSDATQS